MDKNGTFFANSFSYSRSKVDDVFLVVFPIMFMVFNLIYWPMCLHRGEGWLSLGVVGVNIDRDQAGADMMVTTTPILNIDKLDYQYAGLPLGMIPVNKNCLLQSNSFLRCRK
mgnify:CR=1 FL=1